jgi:hypothetical protein
MIVVFAICWALRKTINISYFQGICLIDLTNVVILSCKFINAKAKL